LFAPSQDALKAVGRLESILRETSLRLSRAIHRRLEALARHPDLEVRALAYKIFLLAGPVPDYSQELPSFLLSGLPFLSEGSIEAIANAKIERFRLDALRRRLRRYRKQLSWPAPTSLRDQMDGIFALLETFVHHHPAYYPQVRAELVAWVLHEADKELAEKARGHLDRMVEWFEAHLKETTPDNEPDHWKGKIVFQDRLSEAEIRTLENALVRTTFLKQSIMLAFEERGVEVSEIPPNGIWIAQVFSILENRVYRMSVNTRGGKHYDLLLGTATDREEASVLETTYWMLALGGRADGPPVVRQFGCYRPELGAFSMALVNDLTVWERVRELSGEGYDGFHPTDRHWRNLFVRGMAAFFRGWALSGGRVIPGPVSPANVMVPAPDFRSGGTILTLAGLHLYKGPLSLVAPMLKNFYFPTISYYPQTRADLNICWVFDAAVEALGVEEGRAFLLELKESLALEGVPEPDPGWELELELESYVEALEERYRVPLPLQCAVERYEDWERSNPRATPFARERQVSELNQLYRLDGFGDLGRYSLYRRTYFNRSGPEVGGAFDRLLKRMFRNPSQRPTHMMELSDLQATLPEEADRLVFSHMVFPAGRRTRPVDVMAVGDQERGHVVVRSEVGDDRGEVYMDSGMPLSLSDQASYLLAIDGEDRIVGGICYKTLEPEVAHMDGLVISAALRGNGLGGELLEDFSLRMKSLGVRTINTHFISRPFLRAHGFRLDEEWGGLVRFLGSGPGDGS
jgi:GNAT superfamily N-acetyltransferase